MGGDPLHSVDSGTRHWVGTTPRGVTHSSARLSWHPTLGLVRHNPVGGDPLHSVGSGTRHWVGTTPRGVTHSCARPSLPASLDGMDCPAAPVAGLLVPVLPSPAATHACNICACKPTRATERQRPGRTRPMHARTAAAARPHPPGGHWARAARAPAVVAPRGGGGVLFGAEQPC